MDAIFRDHKDAWIQQFWQQAVDAIVVVMACVELRAEDAIGTAALLFSAKLIQGVAEQILDRELQTELRPPIVVPFLSLLVLSASIFLAARAPPLILALEWESLAASAISTFDHFMCTCDIEASNLDNVGCVYNSMQAAQVRYYLTWLCICWGFRHAGIKVLPVAFIAILRRCINFNQIAERWQPILELSRLPDVGPQQCYNCVICSEEMTHAKSLACNHRFHGLCLARWRLEDSRCPLCRKTMVVQIDEIHVLSDNLDLDGPFDL